MKIRSFYVLLPSQQGGCILAFLPPDLRPCSKLPNPQGVVRLWRRCTRRSRRGSPIVKELPWRPHPLKNQQPLSRMWHLSHFLGKHPYWALDAAYRDIKAHFCPKKNYHFHRVCRKSSQSPICTCKLSCCSFYDFVCGSFNMLI